MTDKQEEIVEKLEYPQDWVMGMDDIREATGIKFNQALVDAMKSGELKGQKVARKGPIGYTWAIKKTEIARYLKWKREPQLHVPAAPVANGTHATQLEVDKTLILKEGVPIMSHTDCEKLVQALWAQKGGAETLEKAVKDLTKELHLFRELWSK